MILPLKPDRFREPSGTIFSTYVTGEPPIFTLPMSGRRKHMSKASIKGLRYEAKVHTTLTNLYPKNYVRSPWIRFIDDHGVHWCQPDGLYIDINNGFIIIVEIKSSHTGAAWWQLTRLYEPVVRAVFGDKFEYRTLEIVSWFNPDIVFPNIKMVSSPSYAPKAPFVGVHILPENNCHG